MTFGIDGVEREAAPAAARNGGADLLQMVPPGPHPADGRDGFRGARGAMRGATTRSARLEFRTQGGSQRLSRERCLAFRHVLRRSFYHYVSARCAAFRSKVDDPVG